MTTTAAAHIVLADADLGDPAVIVMTVDTGEGARAIETFHLTSDATFDTARMWIAGGASGWTRTGADPVLVARGYWIVEVERDA